MCRSLQNVIVTVLIIFMTSRKISFLRQHSHIPLTGNIIPDSLCHITNFDIVCPILQNPFHRMLFPIDNHFAFFYHFIIPRFVLKNILNQQPMREFIAPQGDFSHAVSRTVSGYVVWMSVSHPSVNPDMPLHPDQRPDGCFFDGGNGVDFGCPRLPLARTERHAARPRNQPAAIHADLADFIPIAQPDHFPVGVFQKFIVLLRHNLALHAVNIGRADFGAAEGYQLFARHPFRHIITPLQAL